MSDMITALRKTNIFLLISAGAILIGITIILGSNKIDSHLLVNSSHTNFQDFFFTWITYAGDGTVLAIASALVVALTWKKYGASILLFATMNLLLVAAVVQTLKHAVYYDAFRPVKFIGGDLLYLIPELEIHTDNSFPSGHTTAAFAFFAFISLVWNPQKWIQIACATMALLAGYSRIYLSQHFLEDVVAGATIGVTCYIITFLVVRIIPFKNNIAR